MKDKGTEPANPDGLLDMTLQNCRRVDDLDDDLSFEEIVERKGGDFLPLVSKVKSKIQASILGESPSNSAFLLLSLSFPLFSLYLNEPRSST